MSFNKLPSFLNGEVVFLIDSCLSDVNSSFHLGLSLCKEIINNRIATNLVVNSLKDNPHIDFSLIPLNEGEIDRCSPESKILVISKNGDGFLLERKNSKDFILLSCEDVDSNCQSICSSFERLKDDFF